MMIAAKFERHGALVHVHVTGSDGKACGALVMGAADAARLARAFEIDVDDRGSGIAPVLQLTSEIAERVCPEMAPHPRHLDLGNARDFARYRALPVYAGGAGESLPSETFDGPTSLVLGTRVPTGRPTVPATGWGACTCAGKRDRACPVHGAWRQLPPKPPPAAPAPACGACDGAGGRYDEAIGTWTNCGPCAGSGSFDDATRWDGDRARTR